MSLVKKGRLPEKVVTALKKVFYNPSTGYLKNPVTILKRLPPTIQAQTSVDDVKRFLDAQSVVQVNRQVRKGRNQHGKVVSLTKGFKLQGDLLSMSSKTYKQPVGVTPFNWLLVVVDVYSRFAWVAPLRSKGIDKKAAGGKGKQKKRKRDGSTNSEKSADDVEVKAGRGSVQVGGEEEEKGGDSRDDSSGVNTKDCADALERIFREVLQNESVSAIYSFSTDAGTEFNNSSVNKVYEEYSIVHRANGPAAHNAVGVVERLNHTIRTRLQLMFSARKSREWSPMINDIIENYNNTTHSALNTTPAAVWNGNELDDDEDEVDDEIKRLATEEEGGGANSTKKRKHDALSGAQQAQEAQTKRLKKWKGKMKPGSLVRIRIPRKTFQKATHTKTWSDALYVVTSNIDSMQVEVVKVDLTRTTPPKRIVVRTIDLRRVLSADNTPQFVKPTPVVTRPLTDQQKQQVADAMQTAVSSRTRSKTTRPQS